MDFSSILISDSGKRNHLFFRTLKSIERNPPSTDYEVVVASDNLNDYITTIDLLREFSFASKLILVDNAKFEQDTGLIHFFNNPSLTNNAAFMNISPYCHNVFLIGNEIILYKNCFDVMLKKRTKYNQIVFSTTYDIPEQIVKRLNKDGSNIDELIGHCTDFPLASPNYKSDVTNYCSLIHKSVWSAINGYDNRFVAGYACEDSDFVRRCRTLLDFETIRCGNEAISLHQFHGGQTCYYKPKPEILPEDKMQKGLTINREHYHSWMGQTKCKMGMNDVSKYIINVIEL